MEQGYVPKNNRYEIKINMTANMEPGDWYIYDIQTVDRTGNIAIYTFDGCDDPYSQRYGAKITFKVGDNPNLDIDPPVLQDVTISSNTTAYPNAVTLRARVTDNNKVETVEASYTIDNKVDNSIGIILKKESGSGNWYSGTLNISAQPNRYPKYYFNNIFVRDENTNGKTYAYKDNDNVKNGYWLPIDKNLDITITNVRTDLDTTPPELVSITANKSEITSPDMLTFTVKAKDQGGSGLKDASLGMIHFDKKGKETVIYPNTNPPFEFIDGAVVFQYAIPQYLGEGTIKPVAATITDKDGNKTEYNRNGWGIDMSAIANKAIVTVKEADKSNELSTGTLIPNMVDKIKRVNDNAVIRVDCQQKSIFPKEGFDAIKGTNKKLMLEANGITWTFFGNQLSKSTKDIDVSIQAFISTTIKEN